MAAIKKLAPSLRPFQRPYDHPDDLKTSSLIGEYEYSVEIIENSIPTNWSLIPQEYEHVIASDFLAISQPSKINFFGVKNFFLKF